MILWRASFRYLQRHPLQVLFAVVGVALGVAVVVAIDLANSSAERAFRLSADALTGRTTHVIVGGSRSLDESTYRRLRLQAGWRQSAPVVEGYARVPDRPGLTLKVVGVDPFAEAPFRSYSPGLDGRSDLDRLLTEPGAALMTPATATALGLAIGDRGAVNAGGVSADLVRVGTLQPRDPATARALENLVLVDISSAQEILGLTGRLTRIDLIVPEEAALAALRRVLPAEAAILPANAQARTMAEMTRAFQLNLQALSLLALVVGMFLIYNTMTFSVLQRRALLGTLRTLGVTRREVFRLILVEAVLIGALGTALGLLAGVGLASGLLAVVTRTINDLYFVLNVQILAVTPLALAKGILLGLGATTCSALVPALEAARTEPRAVLMRSQIERRQRRLLPWSVACGGALLALGALGLVVPGHSIPAAFLFMFLLIAGYALVTPAAFVWLLHRLQPLAAKRFGMLGKLAVRSLHKGLSRTGVASAALVIAVAATVGMGLMIHSFRSNVAQWLQSYLQADIYVTTASTGSGPGRAPLDTAFLAAIETLDGIRQVTRARHQTLASPDGLSELFVAEIPWRSFTGYWFEDGDPEAIYQAFRNEDAVIVSAPYAYHHGLERGAQITLRTDAGPRRFKVAGVFTDYGSDRGRVTISRQLYQQYWTDRQVDALGIYLEEGVDVAGVVARLRQAAVGRQQLEVYANRDLREASLATFDRTFAVTAVLRLLAVLVAFIGILNALMAMQIERARELAVLRATGLTPGQLWQLVMAETGLVGGLAGLLALPLGLLQALVLIFVINQRSFGWSMQFSFDAAVLLQAVGLSVTAALLAGLYPAWRMARTAPALAMRYE